jgi:Leucine-rich repeat (LRR) protein
VIKFDGSYYESYKFNYGLERAKKRLKYGGSIKELYIERKISFNYIHIDNIPFQIGNLINLKQLYLYQNILTSIPVELCNLTNLKVLVLSNNKLTYIPSELGNLKKLKHLNLHTNKLNSIPVQIGSLHKLKQLDLCNN